MSTEPSEPAQKDDVEKAVLSIWDSAWKGNPSKWLSESDYNTFKGRLSGLSAVAPGDLTGKLRPLFEQCDGLVSSPQSTDGRVAEGAYTIATLLSKYARERAGSEPSSGALSALLSERHEWESMTVPPMNSALTGEGFSPRVHTTATSGSRLRSPYARPSSRSTAGDHVSTNALLDRRAEMGLTSSRSSNAMAGGADQLGHMAASANTSIFEPSSSQSQLTDMGTSTTSDTSQLEEDLLTRLNGGWVPPPLNTPRDAMATLAQRSQQQTRRERWRKVGKEGRHDDDAGTK